MTFFDASFNMRLFVMDCCQRGTSFIIKTYKKTRLSIKILKVIFQKFHITIFWSILYIYLKYTQPKSIVGIVRISISFFSFSILNFKHPSKNTSEGKLESIYFYSSLRIQSSWSVTKLPFNNPFPPLSD